MKKRHLFLIAALISLGACCDRPSPPTPTDAALSCNFDHLPGEKTVCGQSQ
ncbi:hypothetical protein [Acetobacter estunensis]|uniref:hypothetical protein n=1 Tax=Acetobacter estunensis TaxID=104097 RepID=UPI001407B0CF|nr:hypothetical protein [Acetobacter estunensis]